MSTVNWSLQHKRDTAANWTANNPTLLAGQLGIETDGLTTTPKFKIGDGVSTWNALPYFYGGSASAQDLNNVLTVGNSTSGQDITLTTDDLLKFGTTTAAIYNDSNIIDPNHIALATNTTFTGHTHILLSDGANEWHDESANAFISIMAGAVPNNSIQIDASNDKINIFSGANGLNLQNDTYLNSLTASRLLSTDANKKISALTGTGILTLTAGAISYDTNTYLTTSAAALAYQPLDSDLTSWAGVTRASGFDTFVATPSSANLAALVTGETGSGALVFGTSPTFTTDITTPLIIGGSAVGSTIQYKGTSGVGTSTVAAHQFLVGNNGATTAASIYNSGQVSIGNYASPTAQRILTIGQGTSWITFGSYTALGGTAAMYINVTPSTNNYTIAGTGNDTYFNGILSSNITVNNTVRIGVNGAVTSGASTTFTFNVPANTGQTASNEIPNFKVTGASKTWAAGAITTQRWNYFTANTAAFASASTITNSYGLYVEAATAGTNATITNNWALGTNGNIEARSTGQTKITSISTGTAQGGVLSAENDNSAYARLTCYGSTFGITEFRNNGVFGFKNSGYLLSDGDVANGGTNSLYFLTGGYTPSTQTRLTIDSNGNTVQGTAALATNATNGFLYIESCAGTPTGVPTSYTGRVPIIYDTTNNKFYVYNGGWKAVTLA